MAHEHHHHDNASAATAAKVRDPVCGMMVDPATTVSAEHDGNTYHFCCDGCRSSFVGDPRKYLSAKPFVLPPKPAVTHHHEHPPAGVAEVMEG